MGYDSIRIPYEQIDVFDFLEELGLMNVTEDGDEVFYSCPFPGHSHADATPSASMKIGSTVAYCFGCGWRGNALTFLSAYEGVDPLTAARWIRQRVGDDFQEPEGSFLDEIDTILAGSQKREDRRDPVLDEYECFRRELDWEAAEDCLQKGEYLSVPLPMQYVLDRGFSADVLTRYKVGFDGISQRIVLPYRLENGDLVGFKGRAFLDEQTPRYWVLGGPEYGFQSFNVGRLLYGLDLALQSDEYKVRQHLFVREGELNVLAMAQHGFNNTVGISGKFVSDVQLEILKRVASSATVWFDTLKDSLVVAEKLQPFMPVYVVPQTDEDPAEMTKEQLEQAIRDADTPLMLALAKQ